MITRRFTSLALLALAAAGARAQSVPQTLNYQGRLTDNSPSQTPLTATVNMQFALYDAPSGGAQLWQEPAGAATLPVSVTGGIFSVLLGGNGVPLPASIFTGSGEVYLEIAAGGQTLAPRQILASASFARRAENATSADSATSASFSTNSSQLGGLASSNWQRATNLGCSGSSYIKSIASDGTGVCAPIPANNLTPPVSLSAAIPNPVLAVSQTGTGIALYASTTGADAASRAGYFQASGSAMQALYAEHYGGGYAASFAIPTGASGGTALQAYNSGPAGGAANFYVGGAANSSPALSVSTSGTGNAVYGSSTGGTGAFFMSGGGASTWALRAQQYGGGVGAQVDLSGAGNSSPAMVVNNAGTGTGLEIANTNATPGAALWAHNSNGGTAALLTTNGAGTTMSVLNSGGGGAASFTAGGSATALLAGNTGSGQAGQFQTTGVGPALGVIASGAGGNSLRVTSGAASVIPVIVNGAVGQSVNLQEWRNSSSALLSSVDSLGGFHGNGSALTGVSALDSAALGGLAPASWQRATAQTCATGSFLQSIDATGATTCAAAAANLVAPISITSAAAPAILTVTQTSNGVPEGGAFYSTSASNIGPALRGQHSGGGAGVYGYSATGHGGDFRSAVTGLWASVSTDDGIAAHFQNNGATGYAPTLYAQNQGTGIAGQFSSGTGSAVAAYNNSTGTSALYANNAGIGQAGNFVASGAGPALVSSANGAGGISFRATAGAATVIPMVAQGAASQSASLQEWRNNSGSALASVDSAGGMHAASSSFFNLFATNFYSGTTPVVDVAASSNPGTDIQVWRIAFGATVAKVDNGGRITSTGLTTSASGTNPALQIDSGSLKVSGAGLGTSTPVFIHKATAGTISGNTTTITNPFCDGDPGAILIITPNYTAGGGIYNNHPIGVYYIAGVNKWAIFNQDLATMPTNAAFNVLVFKP